MKTITIIFLTLFAFSFSFSQNSREEKALQALIDAGMVKKNGNNLIFKVKKASDTAMMKMMYGAFFKNENWNIGFDVDGKYFGKRNQTPKDISILTTKPKNETPVYTHSAPETATISHTASTPDQIFFQSGTFLIRNARDYRYLTIRDEEWQENSPTFLNSYFNKPNRQEWKLIALNDGFYKIQSLSGLCLIYGLAPHLKPFANTDDQLWKLEDSGDGFYYITPKKNNLYMYLSTSKNIENGRVTFKNKSKAIEEKWHLIKWTNDGRKMTTFNPEVHGFRFINEFNGEDFIRWGGLCGGMVYTALDYFNKRMEIPKQYYMPANETTLQSYIYGRQQNSIWDVNSNWTELEVSYNTRASEIFRWGIQGTGGGRLQELKTAVNDNKSVPVGLFAGGILGKDDMNGGRHVILGIGYAMGRYTGDLGKYKGDYKIFIYNPNNGNVRLTLVPDLAKECYFEVETGYAWRTYFVNNRYGSHNPPGDIVDYPEGQEEGRVRHLYATFVTSNDDLRGGNDNINITIRYKNGTEQRHLNVNNGARWVNNSIQTVHLTLDRAVRKEDIQDFIIGFTGATTPAASDNWNLHSLTIYSGRGGIHYAEVVAPSGSNYYYRFSQSNRFLTVPTRP